LLGLLDYAVVGFCAQPWFFYNEVGNRGIADFHDFFAQISCARNAEVILGYVA